MHNFIALFVKINLKFSCFFIVVEDVFDAGRKTQADEMLLTGFKTAMQTKCIETFKK